MDVPADPGGVQSEEKNTGKQYWKCRYLWYYQGACAGGIGQTGTGREHPGGGADAGAVCGIGGLPHEVIFFLTSYISYDTLDLVYCLIQSNKKKGWTPWINTSISRGLRRSNP